MTAGEPTLFDDLPPDEGASGSGADRDSRAGLLAPLAERMRPATLDEVVGQREVVALLERAVHSGHLGSLIFWGPPGTGKTTLARLLAAGTRSTFLPFSAVTSGIKEIKEVMVTADRLARDRKVVLFVDEIHRFNRAQQDAFLPYVERGTVVLVGATTENPSFELNSALLSRCRVLVLRELDDEDVRRLLERALQDADRGLGAAEVDVDDRVLDAVIALASGDARRALGTLEMLVEDVAADRRETVSLDDLERLEQRRILRYDKSGEEHFNLISALHKSLRESDPDAAVYWLLRMLEGGESPAYVARRMVRFATEDVGLADPAALGRVLAAWDAYDRLGSPEGDQALVQAAIDLALSPKSVAVYRAESSARRAIAEHPQEGVPLALRNAPTDLMKEIGYGRDYEYAPDSETGVAGLQCLPDRLVGERFYQPGDRGHEAELGRRLAEIEERRRKASSKRTSPRSDDLPTPSS